MNYAFYALLALSFVALTGCQNESQVNVKKSPESKPISREVDDRIVEASCGQCQFGMQGGCDLAVRFDGKSYFADGSSIDDHGDAHADNGLCNCVRKAKVTGQIKDGRFVATSFEVLPKDG